MDKQVKAHKPMFTKKVYLDGWFVQAEIYRGEELVTQRWFCGFMHCSTAGAAQRQFNRAHRWANAMLATLIQNED